MASPFAKLITQVLEVPDDAGQTITIQKLTGRAVERAQAIAAEKTVNGRGFATKVAKALEAAKDGSQVALDAILRDPLNGYDRMAVLHAGIVGWSYDVPCTAEHIDQLDDERSEFVALEILKLTKPHLFEGAEVAQKKGSSRSIGVSTETARSRS